jgi:outer membrane protein insertion porin family
MLGGNRLLILGFVVGFLLGDVGTPSALMAQGAMRGMGPSSAGPPGPAAQKKRYTPPQVGPIGPQVPVVEVRITGDSTLPADRVRARLETRPGRPFDGQLVQDDIRRLLETGRYYDAKSYREDTSAGVIVTFELFERPTIGHVRFQGNTVWESTLQKKCELKVGEPLNRYRVEEAARKLEEFYHNRGNSQAAVSIQEGITPGDRGVTFEISEGPRQRIFYTRFVGNTIASDARLRTQIKSKPGILWVFKGQVDNRQIDEDLDRLTAYYRSLGFFRAKVGRELEFDKSGKWLTLTYVIDEGPRYVVRNVSLLGNHVFATDELLTRLELHQDDFFDMGKMNRDVNQLRDAYGAQGYIFADIQAQPRFLEEPGQLDLVYNISEGKQYRVNQVIVNIEGEYPHTRHSVVRNRISVNPGDIIDIREVRASERRLKASQLFEVDPVRGPTIAIRPRDANEGAFADRSADTY